MATSTVNFLTPIRPERLSMWFQGCPECLGVPCDCAPAPIPLVRIRSALVDRLALGRKYAKMRREASKARLARARSFKKPSRVRCAVRIQHCFRSFQASRARRTLSRSTVPACSICGTTELLDPGSEVVDLVHCSDCPDSFSYRLSCHCGKIFCRDRELCREVAVERYKAKCGFLVL